MRQTESILFGDNIIVLFITDMAALNLPDVETAFAADSIPRLY